MTNRPHQAARAVSPWRAAFPGLALLVLIACSDATSAQATSPVYLECEQSDPAPTRRDDAVMIDRAENSIVWMHALPGGRWRRTTFEIVATTPDEVVGRAQAGPDAEHLTIDLAAGEWRTERDRARSDNPIVWDASRERMGYGEEWQLYQVDRGPCQPAR